MLQLEFENNVFCQVLYGYREKNLRKMEKELGVYLRTKGNQIEIEGDEESSEKARSLLILLYQTAEKGFPVYPDDIERLLLPSLEAEGEDHSTEKNIRLLKNKVAKKERESFLSDVILVSNKGKSIAPKGLRQKIYMDALQKKDLVFGIGPAGTGKTYLAMAMAISYLKQKKVERIILTRPAVEAGEKLGFLPGTLQDKINPYLIPLFDALREMVDPQTAEDWLAREIVEIAPLAFMRGRTLNNAFVVLDEAQNTTREQMKMFLTRLGMDSKAVITGDITQVDLPRKSLSGLLEAEKVLTPIPEISFCYFLPEDVVRHSLVQKIIEAYDRNATNEEKGALLD